MRLPRFRLRVRTLLLLVGLVALALFGLRIYRDGPQAHWLVLKLRYGNAEARRSAAKLARESEGMAMFRDLFSMGSADPRSLEISRNRRNRQAELLIPALSQVANDPDAGCRAEALKALDALAAFHASESEKGMIFRQILGAMRDPEASVRIAAVGSLSGFGDRDLDTVIAAIRSALADPSIEVRLEAVFELGKLGTYVPQAQAEATSILIPLLASREEARVRVKAVWSLSFFGVDHRRKGPDVVPALLSALLDSHVEVRRAVADILGRTTYDVRVQRISSWDRRKDAIIPALLASISDEDKLVRENSAVALFAFGKRDPAYIELIEQAVRDPARRHKIQFEAALKTWKDEQETNDPALKER